MAIYFNGALFKRNLTRFWPLAAACFLAALFIFVVPEAGRFNFASLNQKDIMGTLSVYCAVIVPIMSIFSAIAVFGYLHNPRAAGFVSSLPITRLGLYFTNWLSGLALMLVPALIAGVLYGVLLIGQPVPQWDYLRWLGALIASHIIFFSMAAFFAFLTGNPIMQAFLYVVFNFICIMLYGVGAFVAQTLVFGYAASTYPPALALATWLTPPVAVYGMIYQMSPFMTAETVHALHAFIAVLPWVIYIAFAALMIVFGCLLYRRRHIEAAGDVILHKPVRSVFKYLMGFLIGAVFAVLLSGLTLGGRMAPASEKMLWLALPTMFFGALGCLFAEMLIQKRLRVWKAAYKGVIAFVAALAAVALFILLDGTGYERRVPDPEDVASVSFSSWSRRYISPLHRPGDSFPMGGEGWGLDKTYIDRQRALGLPLFDDMILNEIKLRTPDYFESREAVAAAVRLHQSIVSEKRSLEAIQDNWGLGRYYLTYTMRDGRVITREYVLPVNSTPVHGSVALLLELYNQPESVNKRNRFVPLHDDAVLGAKVMPAMMERDRWAMHSHYSFRWSEGVALMPEDGLNTLVQALRQDAAAGTLGRLRQADLSWYYYQDLSDALVMIDLFLDSGAAGVPSAFAKEFMYDDYNNVIVRGLALTVNVREHHVNTARALRELGLYIQ